MSPLSTIRFASSVRASLICWFAAATFLGAAHCLGDEIDFNRDIRPILSNRCYTCHGPDEATREADLRLDVFDSATEDRGDYQAIAPGKPNESEILERVLARDDTQMPPAENGKPLTKSEVQLLKQWIEEGARYARHWSYEPPLRRKPPELEDASQARNAIDRFVLARLKERGLKLSPEADRTTLIRRLSLDLTGLPPTPEEIKQFVDDKDPEAYDKLVTRLLSSKAYGERWAAMWLDLARYADSAGYANDPPRTIWLYRDWVIKAFNSNMPFDQFTIEQIAGDMLPDATESQKIATAFHRNTLTNSEGGTNDEEFRNVAVVDRVNTTMQVWMGVTIRCAQCHSHKYDPISQEEYFRLFAFFNNTSDSDRANEYPVINTFTDQQQQQRGAIQSKIDQLKKQLTPSDDQLAKKLDAWEAALRQSEWRTLQPVSATASATQLELQDDHSILATGDRAEKDTYQVELKSGPEPITAIRIEALPDPSLPQQGPGRSDGGNFVLSELQLSAGPTAEGQARQGRYVRVELPGKNRILHMAEVEVFSKGENIAPQGKAKQSTTGFDGPAKLAVDGNTSGVYRDKSVTHTATGDASPWWEVDLGKLADIDRVVIWNRTDNKLQSRLDDFVVSLLDEKRNTVWTRRVAKAPKREQAMALNGLSPVKLQTASATFEQSKSGGVPYGGWTAAAAIDGDKKGATWGWAVGGDLGVANAAAFRLASPVKFEMGAKLKLTLKQNYGSGHLLGRFRVLATSDPQPQRLLPKAVSSVLEVASKERNDEQRKTLIDYFRTVDRPSKKLLDQIAAQEKKLASVRPITTPVMVELPKAKRRTTKIQIRGNFMATGDTVTEGVPQALHSLPEKVEPTRMALAEWLVDARNPLTSRVVVNRYWEQLFGVGIVATSEEFGAQGDLPSHPQLLDWLAVDLMESGWDLKHLLRTIVSSSVYRQSSAASPELLSEDPENRWLARGPRFRLSAEMIRDQALRAAGLLSFKMYGPSVRPPRPKLGLKAAFGGSTDWETSRGEDRYRRAVYTSWRRSIPYPSMATFDAPTRNVCTIRRGRTNTPLQALVTLNDPVYVEAAQALARIANAVDGDTKAKASVAFRRAACRAPNDRELDFIAALYERARKQLAETPAEAKQLATIPLGEVENADEEQYVTLAAWTAVANVLLNLDEVLVKH